MKQLGRFAFAAALAVASPAGAFDSNSGSVVAIGQYFANVPMTGVTRPANTTAYAANTVVCGSPCSAMVLTLTPNPAQQGVQATLLNRVLLTKSGVGTTNAAFNLLLFSQPPTLPATDGSAYVGFYTTDAKAYLGQANCTTANLTNDATATVWYECSLSNPNSSGVTVFQRQPTGSQVYGVLQATGAYTPASGEVFTAYLSGVY